MSKDGFLGLCEEGLANGISDGLYCKSKRNKEYAINAVGLLKKDSKLAYDMNDLLVKVTGS